MDAGHSPRRDDTGILGRDPDCGRYPGGSSNQSRARSRGPAPPHGYIPEHGVDAEYFTSPDADAAVIVLEGVEPIPDNLDFSESVGQITTDNLTAATENPEPTEVTQ